jgi:hypothetical protein
MYKFVAVCFPSRWNNWISSCRYLWEVCLPEVPSVLEQTNLPCRVDVETRALYISGDHQDIIEPNPSKTKEFMLLHDLEPKEETQYNLYKQVLFNPKRVTKQEFENKLVHYNNSYWDL